MSAKQKIEGLTNTWYGYFFFAALLKLWNGGFGVINIATTVLSFAFTALVVFFLGRRLVNKSSIWRFLLLCVSTVATLGGTYFAAKMGWAFVTTWQVSALIYAASSALTVYMYGRSLRVLTDSSVKAYINN